MVAASEMEARMEETDFEGDEDVRREDEVLDVKEDEREEELDEGEWWKEDKGMEEVGDELKDE